EQGTGGISTIKDMDIEPLLTRGVIYGEDPVPNEQIYKVTGIAAGNNNPSGHPMCRVTLATVGGSTGILPLAASLTEPRGDPYYLQAWVSGPNLNSNSCSSAGTGAYGNDAAWALIPVAGTTDQYDLAGSAYTGGAGNAIHTNADWSTSTGNTNILRISGSIANIAPGMSVTTGDSSDTRWPGCPSACAVLTVQSVVQRATGPDPYDGYNGEIVVSQPLGQAFTGDPIDIKLYSAGYSDDHSCANNNAPSGGVEG